MHHHLSMWPTGVGWLAAGLTVLTFYCKDARRLRASALAANLAFITYGGLAALWPVLVLHLLLLPINVLRLREALREHAGPGADAGLAQAPGPRDGHGPPALQGRPDGATNTVSSRQARAGPRGSPAPGSP